MAVRVIATDRDTGLSVAITRVVARKVQVTGTRRDLFFLYSVACSMY
jgi:hypothetical protein